MPFLAWTGIYWVFTIVLDGSWNRAGTLLLRDLVYGYYQLYFVVVLLLLYLVFPPVLRAVRSTSHHGAIMAASLLFALLLAADIHFTASFGVLGDWTRRIETVLPWSRDPITYQEQFVAGILVALHFDEVRAFVERWYRQVIAGAVLMGVVATLWYLVAVWTGSPTAALRTSTSRWPSSGSPRPWPRSSAARGCGIGAGSAARHGARRGGPASSRPNTWPA